MSKKIYKAAKIFTGRKTFINHIIIAENDEIKNIEPFTQSSAETIDFGEAIIAPAFIDIQIYGAHGRLLSVYPNAATVKEIYAYSKNGGAAYCMPTVATNTYEVIFQCIDAVRQYMNENGKGVLGLHVEGPWISKAKRGAHREEWIFSPTLQQAKQLLEYGQGIIKIITLAPEVCAPEIIELASKYNVTVFAGHSNATYQEAMQAFDSGIHHATHLFNAMSAFQHRAPGMVGAIFNHPGVMCSLVPDGEHVDFAAIKIAKKIMGERLFAITDAVTETTQGYYKHTFDNDKYISNGVLSGSALTMVKCFQRLVKNVGIAEEEALRMCSLYPAKSLQLDNCAGYILPGRKVSFAVLDKNYNLIETIC